MDGSGTGTTPDSTPLAVGKTKPFWFPMFACKREGETARVTFKGLTTFSVNVRQVQVKLDRPRVLADRTPDEIDALGRTPRLMLLSRMGQL